MLPHLAVCQGNKAKSDREEHTVSSRGLCTYAWTCIPLHMCIHVHILYPQACKKPPQEAWVRQVILLTHGHPRLNTALLSLVCFIFRHALRWTKTHRAMEKAFGKVLILQARGPAFDAQGHVQLKPGTVARVCNPKFGEVKWVDFWCSLPKQCS